MSTGCEPEGLTFEFARRHVDAYTGAEDALVKEHLKAMDCYDCEAFLQLGIDAFRWLMRADFVVRQAIYREQYEYDADFDEAIRDLAKRWLQPCEQAQKWVQLQKDRGYTLSNLAEFEKCCEEVRAIVESFDQGDDMPEPLVSLAEEAYQEHKNGQTAEFF